MSTVWGSILLLGGALFWWLWQPPIPESGFSYAIREGNQVWRISGILKRSPVENARLYALEGESFRFMSWAALSSSNAVEGEPLGLCFFDDDGDFSGFLRLSPDLSGRIESVRHHAEGIFILKCSDSQEEFRFSEEAAKISWPPKGCAPEEP